MAKREASYFTPVQLLFGVDFYPVAMQSLWLTILTALSTMLLFRGDVARRPRSG